MRSVPIGALAQVRSGGAAPQGVGAFGDAGHPFVRAGSLPKLLDGETESSLDRLEPLVAKLHGLKLFPSGSVLFAKSGMSATKGHIYRLRQPAYVVSHLAALVPHDQADSAFILHALRCFSPTGLIKDSAYPSIRLGDIESMEVIAPLAQSDRSRVAQMLDRAETLRAQRRQALAQLDAVAESIFLDMFGDPISNPKGWHTTTLGSLGDVQGGLQLSASRNGSLPVEVSYLRVANVYRNRLNLEEIKTFRATAAEVARTLLQSGDLLVVEGHGNPEEIGRCALWDGSIPECSHQNHLIRVRIDPRMGAPAFLSRFINSAGGRRGLHSASNTTSGLNTISVSKVRAYRVLSPPLDLQLSFVSRIGELDRLRLTHDAAIAASDALFASLQHRAFRGEL